MILEIYMIGATFLVSCGGAIGCCLYIRMKRKNKEKTEQEEEKEDEVNSILSDDSCNCYRSIEYSSSSGDLIVHDVKCNVCGPEELKTSVNVVL